ncbi:MAG: LPS-assembly protein LptD [Treponema sp.]|nr:LPS-assembly protein LptD [Treponema sp.]
MRKKIASSPVKLSASARLKIFLLSLLLLPSVIYAQEVLTDSEIQRIELEIKISTLPELAAWCRSLGLSEGGTKADLSKRIRDHFKLPEPAEQSDDGRKVITIESAQTSEYFTLEVVDEEYARLKGDVRISLKDRDSVHRIKANEILFNRTRNIMTARGSVEYIKETGDKTEIFRGENITVNIDDWSSIFLDGASERKLESEGTAYRFEGTVITRDNNEDVMTINNARISNAYNEEALWSISASKLWLLPGSDFAILNAILRVGEIPVMYFPFFYFPADELIFHPVLGYRSREGAFVHTTTYIFGRPKTNAANQSSLTRILGNANDMEKELQGLFLRSTGQKVKDPNELSLKAIFDYYTNLGFYLGLDLNTPKKGMLNALDFSLGIGFTRTIPMTPNGNYDPYYPYYDGTFDWNHSNLFSLEAPFRYRMKTSSSLTGKYSSLSWSFPFYSDPYTDKDFLNRSENMDWFNMIQQGAAMGGDSTTQTEIGSYQWQISGRFTPSLPKLNPYITGMSLSNISTTLAFKTIRDNEIFKNNSESPNRYFFAPDKLTIYSLSGSVSGTLLNLSSGNQGSAANPGAVEEIEDPLENSGVPRSPWPKENNETAAEANEDKLVPPVLTQRFNLPRTGDVKFSIDYTLSPASSTELQFMSGQNNWESYDEVNWRDVQSILSSVGGNGSVNFRFDHTANMFTNTVSFSGSTTFRDYGYLNEDAFLTSQGEVDSGRVEAARRQQYSQTNYSTFYSYNGTLRPLYQDQIFGQSNLQYTFRGTLVRSKRYTDGDSPELAPQWGQWAKEQSKDGIDIYGLNSHRFSANLSANIMDKQQNLAFSADLPPLDGLISVNAAIRIWLSETSASIQFKKPEMFNSQPNNEWKIEPFNLTETIKFAKISTFTFLMILTPQENNEITTITSSLTLWDFKASFSAVKMKPYEFITDALGGRWSQKDEEPALYPRDLTFTYVKSFTNIEIIKNRLKMSLNVNTRLFYDLQRYTNSNFQLTTGFTLGVPGILDITLSATSENAVIFRYFKGIPGLEDQTSMYPDRPENNMFVDLFYSFSFWDDDKRRRSGFKLKRFNLSATHYMGDWRAILDVSLSPYLSRPEPPLLPEYKINTDISFLIQWSAITEIKSDIKYEGRTEKFTVK